MSKAPPASASLPTAGGLSEDEAARRLQRDGPNELPVSRPRGVPRLAREVASEPMFLLLVSCGAIYMVLGDAQEALRTSLPQWTSPTPSNTSSKTTAVPSWGVSSGTVGMPKNTHK